MRTTDTRARPRGDRGASTLEWGGAILVVAAVAGVVAMSGVPGVVSARMESAICEVAQETGCASPGDAAAPVADRGRPADGSGPADRAAPPDQQAGSGRAQALAGGAAKRSGRPKPPDPDTAREQLDDLEVESEGDGDGYDREEFPHWSEQEDNCDTREAVLKRDGDEVKTASDCYPTTGSWHSPYDGETWEDPSDIDIDHMVPLAEAWRSGADEWSEEKREAFANDLENPQLWAVTDNINQEKSDKDPGEWMPPNDEFHCEYARAWIAVKSHWKLTIDKAEKAALGEALETC